MISKTIFFNEDPGCFVLDCSNVTISLGRLASYLSVFLQGKRSIFYSPNSTNLPFLVIKNAHNLDIKDKKTYYFHSRFVGSLKELKASNLGKRKTITLAIKRMLDKNPRRKLILSNLRVIENDLSEQILASKSFKKTHAKFKEINQYGKIGESI